MIMRDDDIIKKVLAYVADERYRQAVLIDGEWGTGKTFFVKEKLLKCLSEELPEKKFYYISLYGVSSSEQIIDEIYSSMVESIIEKKLGEEKGKTVEKGISFASKLVAAGIKYFNIDPSDLPKLSDVQELRRAVIIFDDLERCALDVNQTLGVINNLVEHNDVKIILVANQNEVGKMNFSKDLSHKYQVAIDERVELDENDKQKNSKGSYTKEQLIKRTEQLFSEDIFYKKIKEKLIGLTIYYQSNLGEVFVSVTEKFIRKDSLKEYLKINKQKIVNIFEEKKHYNIRTLIFALIAFEKFYDIIDAIQVESEEYVKYELDRVLKYTLISAINIKSGQSTFSWEKTSSKSGIVYYDIKNMWESRVYGYRFVDDYLLQCNLDKRNVEETILEIVNKKKMADDSKILENSLQYRKLHLWWELEDEEIEESVSKIYIELQQQKYSPRYFKDIIVTFLQLENNGFKCIDYNKIIEPMKLKLSTYTEEFERRYLEVLSDSHDFVEKYNQTAAPLFEFFDAKKNDEKIENNVFLCNHESWDDSFENKCDGYSETYVSDNAFFAYIDSEKFIRELQIAKVAEIHNFMRGVRRVYCFSNLYDYFMKDIPNLKSIVEKINVEEFCQGKKTRKMALDKLKNELQGYLEVIDKSIYKI